MKVCVCIKRVPDVGSRIDLTEDKRGLVTKNLGFTISPHEECAVEAAIQLIEAKGGDHTVLTLGSPAADEQLRDALARGIERGILLETEGDEWDPAQTASAIATAIQNKEAADQPFDLILFGNESADSSGFQVGVRVAVALGRPCLTGMKSLDVQDGKLVAKREVDSGWEVFEAPMPAVISVKEGINLPRYPSLRGTMKAKKKPIDRVTPEKGEAGLQMKRLFHPPETGKQVEMLGEGTAAVPKVVDVLKSLEVMPS
jgi:electron transfer flavoprotein beta subunit